LASASGEPSLLSLRVRKPVINVVAIVHGIQHSFDVKLERLEYTTANDLLIECRALLQSAATELDQADINACRLFAPLAGAGSSYALINPSTTLVSLPRRASLRMQLPPRSINVKFKVCWLLVFGFFFFFGCLERSCHLSDE
jgi:hypothetical protein